MEIRIENENRRSTMVIKKENWEMESLQEKMLLKNTIKGVTKLQLTFLNGDAFYRIDLKNYKSMEERFDGRKIGYKDIEYFMESLSELISRLDDYFLKGEELLLSPEHIYYDEESGEWIFVCLPNVEGNYGAEKLAEYLVEKADEKDVKATEISSEYFNIVAEGRISPSEMIRKIKDSDKTVKKKIKKDKGMVRKKTIERRPEYEEIKKDTKTVKENNSKKSLITGVLICSGLSVIAVGLYIMILMNPSLLTFVGLSGDDYIIAGVIIAGVFASAIIGVIHYYKKYSEVKSDNSERKELPAEDFMESDYLDNEIERAKYSYNDIDEDIYDDDYEDEDEDELAEFPDDDYEEDDDEETVLLNRPAERQEAKARLRGKVNGETVDFSIGEKPFVIGKMSGKVNGLLNDSAVSRLHACIRKNGSRYFINDLNSKNGTCLNERRLQPDENAEIADGDIVKFANVTLKFTAL